MKKLLVDNLLVDNMVDFTVGQQVLVPDREYPANGSVGGTIQWLFDGPDGVKQCTVVLPVGRVRVYNCTDLLQYNVEDDFYGEVNRCMVPGCHGTKLGKTEFCSPCYTACRNCGFKKFTVEDRKHKFIMMQASRQFGVELVTASDTERDETSDDDKALVPKKRKVLFFPHMHPHMYPHTQAQAASVPSAELAQPVPVRSVSASVRQDRAKLRVEKQSAKPVSQGLSIPWVSSHACTHLLPTLMSTLLSALFVRSLFRIHRATAASC